MLRVLALLVLRVELGGGHAYRPINGCQYPREPFLRVAAPSSSSAVVRRTPSLHCPRPCTLSSGQAAHGDQTIGGQTRRDETRLELWILGCCGNSWCAMRCLVLVRLSASWSPNCLGVCALFFLYQGMWKEPASRMWLPHTPLETPLCPKAHSRVSPRDA